MVQTVIGLLLGLSAFPALFFLAFVYPYADLSLKRFWVAGAIGAGLGLVAVVAWLVLGAYYWPKD